MIRTVYRIEGYQNMTKDLCFGPFTDTTLSQIVDQMNDESHTPYNGFPAPGDDKGLSYITDYYTVCALPSIEEVDRWFKTRHQFRGMYRLVSYEIEEQYVQVGKNQLLIDSRHVMFKERLE